VPSVRFPNEVIENDHSARDSLRIADDIKITADDSIGFIHERQVPRIFLSLSLMFADAAISFASPGTIGDNTPLEITIASRDSSPPLPGS